MVKKRCVFEVSWEVCNKVGGIYTVITSKVPYVNKGENEYILIGPYFNQRGGEFIEEIVPDYFKEVFNELKQEGIICHFGKWLVKSKPKVILIDFSFLYSQKDEIKKKLWDWFQIDSMFAPFDYEEPVIFSVAVAKLLDKIQKKNKYNMVAQFHEWMTGAGILWLKKTNGLIGTIFTTHATVLGRAISSQIPDFYSNIGSIDFEQKAKESGVVAKHQIEKASVQNATVFTTVSAITALEAEHILGRKPEVLLPNGLDLENFPSFEETSIKHNRLKHDTKDFIMGFFFPHYSFDIGETLIFFIFGRYEFENKGIDVFIEALGRLNEELKKEDSHKTIISFFFIPAAASTIKSDVLESKTEFTDIKEYVKENEDKIVDKVIYLSTSQEKITSENLFEDKFLTNLKKKILLFSKHGNPSLATHDLKYDNDAILTNFEKAGLENREEDKVKVIFYPAYLKPTDNLLNMDVYEAILAGHLGVFPSEYEPWGYTPLEAAALGTASITTDLAGFGIYVEPKLKKENPGIYVMKRFGKSKEDSINQLHDILKKYVSFTKEERIENKIEARRLAGLADWKNLVKHYFEAYKLAFKN